MEIQDYPNYLIYNDGRVFSKKSNIVIKQVKFGDYENISLFKNGKQKLFKLHRLVALHYIPNPENKSDVDHIDGNKLNNHYTNLRWTSHIENMNNYQRLSKNNTSGFKNICYHKTYKTFQFSKNIYGKSFTKKHKNLNELLWYKFVFLLTT
jgi:hypothetical protein